MSDVPPRGALIGGKYEVREPIGDGATGLVVRARMPGVGDVAIKVMAPELRGDETSARRFVREARALQALSHPSVLRVIDAGALEDGRSYLVTELLEGEGLGVLLRRGALTCDRALALTTELLDGLAYVHERGMLHRDLKPENLFVDHTGMLKILDFGLVKFRDRRGWGGTSMLTQEGAVLGTPGYMAPEQAFGGTIDARADVYAAGAVIFELFAGRPVFVEDDAAAVLRAHALEPVPPLAEARAGLWAHPQLDAALGTALHKTPEGRFENARAFALAVAHIPRPVAAHAP